MGQLIELVHEARALLPGDVAGALDLRERLGEFLLGRQPGRKDMGMIRFLWDSIECAEKGEKMPSLPLALSEEEIDLACVDMAERLYDLGRMLYQELFAEFKSALLTGFSSWDRSEIRRHVSLCGGDLDLINNQSIRLKSVQGILGYAHILSDYYTGETPYPSMVEVHGIFQDLDFIIHLEEIK
jgi:hypothetical protein